jgi:LuxR family maltose regulon positive regulatory protein
METTLLQTKLYIPLIRPNLVLRPRLTEQLDISLHRKLTLISAPAGFGKTTLVSEWVANLQSEALDSALPSNAVVWFSLDESDNDLTRFLTYFVSALQTLETRQGLATNIGKGDLNALQSPQPPPAEGILTTTINEIGLWNNQNRTKRTLTQINCKISQNRS